MDDDYAAPRGGDVDLIGAIVMTVIGSTTLALLTLVGWTLLVITGHIGWEL